MSECHTPPKLVRSCGSLVTSMISGWSASPSTNGYRAERPEPPAERDELRRRQALVAEEHDQMVEQRLADAGNDVVRQRLRQVDAMDLRAERAGNGMHGQRETGFRIHGDLVPAGNCSTSASRPSSPATISMTRSSALTKAVAKRGSRALRTFITPAPTR